MSIELVFEELQEAVIAACKAKDLSFVEVAAQRLGLQPIPIAERSQVLADYQFVDQSGASVRMTARWFDPSGPFQNEPDITRVRLTLNSQGLPPKIVEHEYQE